MAKNKGARAAASAEKNQNELTARVAKSDIYSPGSADVPRCNPERVRFSVLEARREVLRTCGEYFFFRPCSVGNGECVGARNPEGMPMRCS